MDSRIRLRKSLFALCTQIPSLLSFDRGPGVYGAYIIVGVFLLVLFLLVYLLSVFLNLSYRLQLATTL